MRIAKLVAVGLVAFILGIVALFPAAPVVDRIRPQLGPVALEGVGGKLLKGTINTVRSTDDLLPLQFTNVDWTLAPQTLIRGAAGVSFRFDGYGGSGKGLAARSWNGDVSISDFQFNAQAKQLEDLLPVPIATFNGQLNGDIKKITLVDNVLQRFEGTLTWNDALLESPVPTSLGNVTVEIVPNGEQSHVVTLGSRGGDVAMDGTLTVTGSGDFSADVLFTPSNNASQEVLNGLRQMGQPDSQGRVRFVRQGNVNRLM